MKIILIITIILLLAWFGSCHIGNSPTGPGGTDTTLVE